MNEPDLIAILRALNAHGVEYVLIGGAAMMLHGSAYVTHDTDICYDRSAENIERLVNALRIFTPALRAGTGERLPFLWEARTVRNGGSFTLSTSAGDLDILASVSGIGNFAEVRTFASIYAVEDLEIPILSVAGLIVTKRAAGRPKDHLALPELELMREIELREEARFEGNDT